MININKNIFEVFKKRCAKIIKYFLFFNKFKYICYKLYIKKIK